MPASRKQADMAEKIPAIVLALGKKVKMTPIAWQEHLDRIIIVFEQGPKIVFDRETEEVLSPDYQKKLTATINEAASARMGR
jgi:hypothetical protein